MASKRVADKIFNVRHTYKFFEPCQFRKTKYHAVWWAVERKSGCNNPDLPTIKGMPGKTEAGRAGGASGYADWTSQGGGEDGVDEQPTGTAAEVDRHRGGRVYRLPRGGSVAPRWG